MAAQKKPARASGKGSPKPAKIPQPHGGALYAGGVPGHRGGPGAPPSVLRERLRGSFENRIGALEQIADGEALVKTRAPDGKETETLVSASVPDRLKAIDTMAKYGLGTTKELTVEHVSGKLRETDAILARELPRDLYERVATILREVWNE